ncbi:MAG: hypothetical protein ACR652_01950 [Methylocystis sp.]|uniref:hypothetical protein n=1 Tax=Methylocystis sp. TaxID=1911079 RepID=UPI003DA5E96A
MRKWLLLAAGALMIGFGVWSLTVASRYQALCELSYWSATPAELRLCDERAGELGGR